MRMSLLNIVLTTNIINNGLNKEIEEKKNCVL